MHKCPRQQTIVQLSEWAIEYCLVSIKEDFVGQRLQSALDYDEYLNSTWLYTYAPELHANFGIYQRIDYFCLVVVMFGWAKL